MPGSTRSAEMARRFADAGHDVQVVTSQRSGSSIGRPAPHWDVSTEDGYTVHWCHIPYSNAMGFGRRVQAFFKFAYDAARYAARLDGDVILATSTPLTIAIPGVYASRASRCPMVLEIRDLWPELPIAIGALRNRTGIAAARSLERWAYRHSAHIVALSPGMREGILAQGIPPDRVTVIPNACDVDLFRTVHETRVSIRDRHEWLGDRPLVLYAGTLGRINGVSYLARIAQALQDKAPEVQFAVVGDGAETNEIRSLALDLGVLDRTFHMLPAVGKQDVVGWFTAADVVCSLFVDLPQMWMNSANKFFDGLAAGKAVAINYLGWQADVLATNHAGIVLPPADPEEAGNILLETIRSPARLVEMGQAARRLAIRDFDRDKLSRQLLDVLNRVVNP